MRKKPSVISIGRVQTPTLALIVRREWEIEQFVAETYFEVKATFAAGQGEYSGRWFDPGQENKRLTDRQAAENIAAKTKGQPGKIIKVEQKEISEAPPLLFDLTSLTVTVSKRYGFSAEKVLELAQSLYEKKAITYPRTDCAYLPADLIPKLPAHLQAVRREPYLESAGEALKLGVPRGKRVINAVTAHHAIIPTTEKINPEKLSAAEGNLYDLIVRRFLAVWFPAARYQQTEIVTEAAQELFRTKGKILLSPGWKKVYHFEDLEEPGKKTNKGRYKDRLPQAGLLISVEMTGQLEYDLAQVEKGELALEKYMGEVEGAVIRILNGLRTYEQQHGKTPLALATVKDTKKASSLKADSPLPLTLSGKTRPAEN